MDASSYYNVNFQRFFKEKLNTMYFIFLERKTLGITVTSCSVPSSILHILKLISDGSKWSSKFNIMNKFNFQLQFISTTLFS